jgi:hypothetical protein
VADRGPADELAHHVVAVEIAGHMPHRPMRVELAPVPAADPAASCPDAGVHEARAPLRPRPSPRPISRTRRTPRAACRQTALDRKDWLSACARPSLTPCRRHIGRARHFVALLSHFDVDYLLGRALPSLA